MGMFFYVNSIKKLFFQDTYPLFMIIIYYKFCVFNFSTSSEMTLNDMEPEVKMEDSNACGQPEFLDFPLEKYQEKNELEAPPLTLFAKDRDNYNSIKALKKTFDFFSQETFLPPVSSTRKKPLIEDITDQSQF